MRFYSTLFRVVMIATGCGAYISLTGCATVSFAPPKVDTNKAIDRNAAGGCLQAGRARGASIVQDVAGATALIDNVVLAYRCAAHEAADGRQIFEVPSLLSLVAAAMGPTFGLTNDGRIAAAVSAAVLGKANAYYAPKEKAHIIDAALDAALCVQTNAVGVPFFDTTRQIPAVPAGTGAPSGSVEVSTQLQYFQTVSAALYSIERILAKRLSDTGTAFDASSLQAEIEKLKATKDAQEDKLKTLAQTPPVPGAPGAAGNQPDNGVVQVQIELLQTNLQQCVVRAKMT
jgi:hypothetical protein